jgi:LIM domain kinase 1
MSPRPLPAEPDLEPDPEPLSHRSAISAASYFTASEEVSIAAATEGGSVLLLHRFTLIKPGTIGKRLTSSSGGGGGGAHQAHGYGWSALDFFFSSGLLPRGGGAKCDVCTKRLGRKALLECDDCGLRAHIKCGEVAPRDCGLRASSLTRVASAPQPAAVLTAAVGGKAKSKSPSPFLQR